MAAEADRGRFAAMVTAEPPHGKAKRPHEPFGSKAAMPTAPGRNRWKQKQACKAGGRPRGPERLGDDGGVSDEHELAVHPHAPKDVRHGGAGHHDHAPAHVLDGVHGL